MNHNLNLFGPVNSTGYGTHFFNWAKFLAYHLMQKGVNTCIVPRNPVSRPELAVEHLGGLDANFMEAVHLQDQMQFRAPGICLWHPHDMSQFCGDPRIGYTVWETTRLKPREIHHLKQLDYVAVPTQWHKDTLLAEGLDSANVFVWNEGVDATYYTPHPSPTGPLALSDTFTFVNVGKWEKRKGQRVLIDAFDQLVRANPKKAMRLLVAWDNPWMPQDVWERDLRAVLGRFNFSAPSPVQRGHGTSSMVSTHTANRGATIQIHRHLPNRDAVKDLYYAANAGVFPYFAEGWGLSMCEVMAMAKPIAATAWGAPLEFLPVDGYYPITEGKIAQAHDGMWFHGDRGNWFQVKPEHVFEVMSQMYNDDEKTRIQIGRTGSMEMQNHYSWLETTKQTVETLERLNLIQ